MSKPTETTPKTEESIYDRIRREAREKREFRENALKNSERAFAPLLGKTCEIDSDRFRGM